MITENDSLVTDDKKLATIFNDNYSSIIQNPVLQNKKEIVENIVKNVRR